MREGSYYYGENYSPDTLNNLLYPDALQQKIEWAKETVGALNEEHYMKRDMLRINRIRKAISDNMKLLEELE